ncbi:hypothetical protein [Oceanospirillum beijerinckii]|uniref:hypothetical protein n=1 Tax=Oceanospirillum beijerinckii TaxID=64976 RepID=UPI00048668FC|nr:hypothetical protein [Oceanospirillum beijerinckii]
MPHLIWFRHSLHAFACYYRPLALQVICSGLLLLTLTEIASAYNGVKPQADQETLPDHLHSGMQMRIGHNHYLLLDQVRAFAAKKQNDTPLNPSRELSRKGGYSILESKTTTGKPVVWNQSKRRYGIIQDELGLVLHDINQADNIATSYDLKLTRRLNGLKRAYYQVDAKKIPTLMRRLQQDIRVREVIPSLLEQMD